jgi:hypothetical protein
MEVKEWNYLELNIDKKHILSMFIYISITKDAYANIHKRAGISPFKISEK